MLGILQEEERRRHLLQGAGHLHHRDRSPGVADVVLHFLPRRTTSYLGCSVSQRTYPLLVARLSQARKRLLALLLSPCSRILPFAFLALILPSRNCLPAMLLFPPLLLPDVLLGPVLAPLLLHPPSDQNGPLRSLPGTFGTSKAAPMNSITKRIAYIKGTTNALMCILRVLLSSKLPLSFVGTPTRARLSQTSFAALR